MDQTRDRKAFGMLTVIYEHSRRSVASLLPRKLNSDEVLAVITELFRRYGPPDHIRSDDRADFTATAVSERLGRIGVEALYIELSSPWENGHNEAWLSALFASNRQHNKLFCLTLLDCPKLC